MKVSVLEGVCGPVFSSVSEQSLGEIALLPRESEIAIKAEWILRASGIRDLQNVRVHCG